MSLASFELVSSLIIVFLLFLFSAFLISNKVERKTSNYLLASFILLSIPDNGGIIIDSFLHTQYQGLQLFLSTTIFLALPILYLYVHSVIYSDFKLKSIFLCHMVGFVTINLVLLPRFYSVELEDKLLFLEANNHDRNIEFLVGDIVYHLQSFAYLIASILAIRKYKTLLLENYSNSKMFNYKWLFQLLAFYSIYSLAATFKNLFRAFARDELHLYFYYLTALLFLGLISWLVLRAMRSPDLFKGIDSNLQLVKTYIHEDHLASPYSSLSESEKAKEELMINQLQGYMVQHEPHLEAELTIQDLSKQIGIPNKELSLLINRNLDQHFFDFVNGYRVKKAMDLLKTHSKQEMTIKEVFYESGFNSKSTFNAAFKKYALITPTAYRLKNNS